MEKAGKGWSVCAYYNILHITLYKKCNMYTEVYQINWQMQDESLFFTKVQTSFMFFILLCCYFFLILKGLSASGSQCAERTGKNLLLGLCFALSSPIQKPFVKDSLCWQIWDLFHLLHLQASQEAMSSPSQYTAQSLKKNQHTLDQQTLQIHELLSYDACLSLRWG